MKKTVFIMFACLAVLHFQGFSQKAVGRLNGENDTLTVDSLSYKLIIFDPGFDTWLASKPAKEFYSQGYYEQRNRLYVAEWNTRYMTGRDGRIYETYIDYDPQTNYGLDINYRLYYYFKYFEETNRIRLYPSSR